jgi:hypothetical protein
MSQTIPDQRLDSTSTLWTIAPHPGGLAGPDTSTSLAALTAELQRAGHVVHARYADRRCGDDSRRVVGLAHHFLGLALALTEAAASNHAYIRLYQSRHSLFVEVTHLAPRSFHRVADDPDGQAALDALAEWACFGGHVLSVRRGPRGQLRIAAMIGTGGSDLGS